MVGWDTPEPIRSGRPCKTSHGAGYGQRTENPLPLGMGSVNAGDQDPVGDMGKGMQTAYRCFQKVGMRDVSCKLYHGLRHEILNETGRQYVFCDVLQWLEAHC